MAGSRYNTGKPMMHLISPVLLNRHTLEYMVGKKEDGEHGVDAIMATIRFLNSQSSVVGWLGELTSAKSHLLRGSGSVKLLYSVGEVLTMGAKKYAPRNWEQGLSYVDTADCIIRHGLKHLHAVETGDETLKLDEESGLPHVAHMLCNIMFLLHFEQESGKGIDDRRERMGLDDNTLNEG